MKSLKNHDSMIGGKCCFLTFRQNRCTEKSVQVGLVGGQSKVILPDIGCPLLLKTAQPFPILTMTPGINRLTFQPVVEFVYKRFRQDDHK